MCKLFLVDRPAWERHFSRRHTSTVSPEAPAERRFKWLPRVPGVCIDCAQSELLDGVWTGGDTKTGV